ncbi:hypothetical protein [Methanopyrus kandleri]|uniref:Uncharacterized protein n=2 Tax=Methanopyrus kandleri TaxID=2320 RepID=Q8TYJ1_METKA|nr:hypothetical protein [Methanopyrus kandleri]AAM01523.1 Uncharacterized protein MK0306 [Methanopyrus kandleri AV19]HII70547.1 hypothetical protein [Methanopyrus kandleri]
MDGSSGLSMCFHLVHEIGRKLDDVEDIVDDAIRLCDEFLQDKLDVDEFKKRLDDMLTRGGGIVGNSGDVKDAAYSIEQAVEATVARVSDLLEKWSREDESKARYERLKDKLEGLRGWVFGGLALSLLAGVLVQLAPQEAKTTLLQALSAITQVLAVVLQLVQVLHGLLPVPISA